MNDYTIAVLVKAVTVVETMAQATRPVTLTEIAKTTSIPKNSVFRILRTLESCGWVAQAKERWFIDERLLRVLDEDLNHKIAFWQQNVRGTHTRREDSGDESVGDGAEGHQAKEAGATRA